jgi:hypothetical protein
MRPHRQIKQFQHVSIMFIGIGGGRSEIRTHGRLAPTAVFKTAALNHSAILPTTISTTYSVSCVLLCRYCADSSMLLVAAKTLNQRVWRSIGPSQAPNKARLRSSSNERLAQGEAGWEFFGKLSFQHDQAHTHALEGYRITAIRLTAKPIDRCLSTFLISSCPAPRCQERQINFRRLHRSVAEVFRQIVDTHTVIRRGKVPPEAGADSEINGVACRFMTRPPTLCASHMGQEEIVTGRNAREGQGVAGLGRFAQSSNWGSRLGGAAGCSDATENG